MKRFLLSLGVLCAALTGSGMARAVSCPNLPARIEVSVSPISPELYSSAPRKELSFAAEMSRPGLADGITDINFNYLITRKAPNFSKDCQAVTYTVQLMAFKAVVYLAAELDPNSCRYRAVIDHELKHVGIAQRALEGGARHLRKQLENPFVSLLVAHQGEGLEDNPVLKQWLSEQAVAALTHTAAQYQAGNEALDTPAEGRRMAAMCLKAP